MELARGECRGDLRMLKTLIIATVLVPSPVFVQRLRGQGWQAKQQMVSIVVWFFGLIANILSPPRIDPYCLGLHFVCGPFRVYSRRGLLRFVVAAAENCEHAVRRRRRFVVRLDSTLRCRAQRNFVHRAISINSQQALNTNQTAS